MVAEVPQAQPEMPSPYYVYGVPSPPPTKAQIAEAMHYAHEDLLELSFFNATCQRWVGEFKECNDYLNAVPNAGVAVRTYMLCKKVLAGYMSVFFCDPVDVQNEIERCNMRSGEIEADLTDRYHNFLKELHTLRHDSMAVIRLLNPAKAIKYNEEMKAITDSYAHERADEKKLQAHRGRRLSESEVAAV